MSIQPWCILATHPLAVQVADKYGLFRDDAKTIINTARKDDPDLQNNDNISLSFLESRDSFKNALRTYLEKTVNVEKGIASHVRGEKTEAQQYPEELETQMERKYSPEEVQEMMDRYDEINRSTSKSKISTQKIIDFLSTFKDTRRLEFLGDWVCKYISDQITLVATDRSFGFEKHNTRVEYYEDKEVIKALRGDLEDLFSERADDLRSEGKEDLAKELECVRDNIDTLLYMYGGNLFRAEGVRVNMEGTLNRGVADVGEDDDPTDGETPTSYFSASDQNKSVTTKIAPDIKVLLSNIHDVDTDGNEVEDKYGYGLWTYISVPLAVNKILTITNGASTYQEAIRALKRNKKANPWITQLLNALDTEIGYDASGEIEVSKSKKEQLQSMFYQSSFKQHTTLRTTYMSNMTSEEGGHIIFNDTYANVRRQEDVLSRKVRNKFRRMSGAKIFKDGAIDFDAIRGIHEDIFGTRHNQTSDQLDNQMREVIGLVQNAAREARYNDTAINIEAAKNKLAQAETHMRQILSDLGLDVSKETMESFFANGYSDAKSVSDSIFGSSSSPETEEIAVRYSKLKTLVDHVDKLLRAFSKWEDAQKNEETSDTPLTNPFEFKAGKRSNYKNIGTIRAWYSNIIEELAEFSQETIESMSRINKKTYYSWNNPSSILTIIDNLSKKDKKNVQEYIIKKYGQDATWFLKPGSTSQEPHFYSDWLEDLFHGQGRSVLRYSEKPVFCEKDYDEQSDVSYAISILNDYFMEGKDTAWYRMLIASDKPRYSSVKFRRHSNRSLTETGAWSEENYHNVVARKAMDFFAQEIKRSAEVIKHARTKDVNILRYDIEIDKNNKHVFDKIKKKEEVTVDDVVRDGRYIFSGSGASFYLNKFIVGEIERNTELGRYVVDRVFNTWKGDRQAVDDYIVPVFKKGFHDYMQRTKEDYFNKLYNSGALDAKMQKAQSDEESDTLHLKYFAGALRKWHQDEEGFISDMYLGNEAARDAFVATSEYAKREDVDLESNPAQSPLVAEIVQLREDIEEFTYNNWLAKANMSEVFDVDLAFYGNTTNFQKRNAQVVSAGFVTDPDAKIHGKNVSDGFNRSITVKTSKEPSSQIKEIETGIKRVIKEIKDPKKKRQVEAGLKDTINELKKVDSTDGQAYTSLTGLRKRRAGQGEWSRSDSESLDNAGCIKDNDGNVVEYIYTDEAVYQRFKRNWSRPEDKDAMVQDFLHVFAQPQKPFVFAFTKMARKGGRGTITVPVQHKNSEYALIFMSAFMQNKEPESQLAAIAKFLEESAKINPQKGIDTVNYDSAVKIGGNDKAIDISGLSPQETLEKLREAVYGDKNAEANPDNYQEGVVTTYECTDYKIQQQKPEHFKRNAQPMGTQMKILAINNIPDDLECTIPNGEKIAGKELKKRYLQTLLRKTSGAEFEFKKKTGLLYPLSKRLHRLSNSLKTWMSTDDKFTVESRRALSITDRDGIEQFTLPLDDPGTQGAVEAMLYSKIRKVYYKEKTNGGVVVQASSWGEAEDLHIRFYSSYEEDIEKRGGILMTKEEFAKESGFSGEGLDKAFENYRSKYQKGYAYFEAEIPMPDYVRDMIANKDGSIDKKYFNENGTWNMEAIKKVVPDSVFDAISYRIPTEAKYSMMLCRIVRFSPEWAGSAAKYPKEITTFTGSDFDIDTDYVELRPIPGSKTENVDNELFDLQMAALRSNSSILETFKPGDFSDLSELSYYVTLIRNGYKPEDLEGKDAEALKKMCERIEDLDLMNPVTDIVLHNQNSDAGRMIGIAAVGVTSHAFLSLYNDITDVESRNPLAHPENFVTIRFRDGATATAANEAFTVRNDKDKDNVTEMFVGGNVFLDMTHDMDGKLIGTEISKYVGASADAAKDAALYRLNITDKTMPILIFMHRLGISSDVARLFIAQPVIRRVVAKMNSASAFGYNSLETIIEDVKIDIANENRMTKNDMDREWGTVQARNNNELVYSELLNTLVNPESQTVQDQLKMLHIFSTLSKVSDSVRNLDSFTRFNSGKAMSGSTFLDRYASRKKIEKLQRNLSTKNPRINLPKDVRIDNSMPEGEFGRLCSMFPYIAKTVLGEQELAEKIIQDQMKTYSPAFFKVAKRLNIEEDAESLKDLYAAWKNYLLFVGPNRIADFTNKEIAEYYTRNFAAAYSQELERLEENKELYDDVIKDNMFLNEIGFVSSKDGFADFDILSTSINGSDPIIIEQIKRDWEALIDHPETRKLGTDLAIYFLARSAAFSRDTPVHIMPLRVKEAIEGYTDAFNNADRITLSDDELEDFIAQFALNNSENKKIVPHFYNSTKITAADINPAKVQDPEGNEFDCYSITFPYNRVSKWLFRDNDAIRFRCPVLAVNDQLFIVLENDVEVNGPTNDDESDKEKTATVAVVPVGARGIPEQMSEYTGLDDNLFDPEINRVAGDVSIEAPFVEEVPYEETVQGRRVGTSIESVPYGLDDIPLDMDRYLARDSDDYSSNAYLESRTHIKRAEKLANAFGFKMSSIIRGAQDYSPAYIINLAAKEFGMNQHEDATKVAALISSLGFKVSNAAAKTYVSPNDDFDAVEVAIPLKKSSRINNAVDILNNFGFDFTYDAGANEILVYLYGSDTGDAATDRKNMTDAVRSASSMLADLRKAGMTDASVMELNYVKYTRVDKYNSEKILNEIKDESGSEESARDAEAANLENPRVDGRSGNRKEIRVSDLARLAIRRSNGEKVEDEVRKIFGERRRPLRNTSVSYTANTLADKALKNMDGNVVSELQTVLEESSDSLSVETRVNNAIINVANWILGNRPEDMLYEMMGNNGIPQNVGASIVSTIKKTLDDLDIC